MPKIDILCLPFFTFFLSGEVQGTRRLRSSWHVYVVAGSARLKMYLTSDLVLPRFVLILCFGSSRS